MSHGRHQTDDGPRTRARCLAPRAGRPHPGVQPDLGGDRRADGPRRRPVSTGQPGARAHGPPRGYRIHRARLRQHHAGLHHHPGVLRPRLQDPVGAEGQLADRAHAGTDLRKAGGHRHPRRSLHPPRHPLRARGDHHPQAGVRRRGRRDRQDHGAVVPRLPLLRRRALPAAFARRPGCHARHPRQAEEGHRRLRGSPRSKREPTP